MPEYAAKSVRSFFCKSVKLGLMQRGFNEAFDSSRAPGNQTEPMYLYSLALWERLSEKSGAGSWRRARLRGYEVVSL
jgi:hypothetical protein